MTWSLPTSNGQCLFWIKLIEHLITFLTKILLIEIYISEDLFVYIKYAITKEKQIKNSNRKNYVQNVQMFGDGYYYGY